MIKYISHRKKERTLWSEPWGPDPLRLVEKFKNSSRNIFRVGKYVYILGGLKKVVWKKIWGHLGVRKWPLKFDRAIKKSKFNFVVEYPTWVSIKRYLMGKLTLACQNLIYCLRLNKNAQKPSQTEHFRNTVIFGCFWTFSFKRMQ